MTRPVFSSGAMMLPFVLAASPAVAQRPVDTSKLENYALAQPLELPTDDAEAALQSYLQKVLASALDPALPPLEIDRWLTEALWPHVADAGKAKWILDQCEDLIADVPRYSPELCAAKTLPLPDDRSLTSIGDWLQGSDGRSGWVVHPPSVRDLYIGARSNSLDIRSLSELRTGIDLPVERWPNVEFEVAVNASPLRATPGDLVTFTIQVRNTGKRDAQRAEVHFSVSTEGKMYEYLWFPSVPAGRSVAVEHAVRLPDGRGTLQASVLPHSTTNSKPFKEADPSNNRVVLLVHQVSDPPMLPVVVPR